MCAVGFQSNFSTVFSYSGLFDYHMWQNVEGKGPCEQLVSPEPEIYVERRQDDDEFLVLACDGIWDVMTNEDLCAFVQSRLLLSNDLEAITNHVVDTCLHKVSLHNGFCHILWSPLLKMLIGFTVCIISSKIPFPPTWNRVVDMRSGRAGKKLHIANLTSLTGAVY